MFKLFKINIVREIYFRDLLKKIIKKNGERIYEENDQ